MAKDVPCAYCSKPGAVHRDHVVPRSRGGPDNAANIVMTCQSCNSSKGDQLPSEWLGDRAPAAVLLVEARVNAKLKSIFKRRDAKAPEPQFALTSTAAGRVESLGRVISESPESVRVEVINILTLWAGYWEPTGEMVDFPRSRCRLFADRDSCLAAYDKATALEESASVR